MAPRGPAGPPGARGLRQLPFLPLRGSAPACMGRMTSEWICAESIDVLRWRMTTHLSCLERQRCSRGKNGERVDFYPSYDDKNITFLLAKGFLLGKPCDWQVYLKKAFSSFLNLFPHRCLQKEQS